MTELQPPVTPGEPLSNWRALLRNFGTLATGEILARVFGFVAVIVMARKLDPASFGLITLGTALVVWFGIIVDSGTETLNVRDISRRPEHFRQISEPVLGLRLALSLGVMVAFIGAAVAVTHTASDRIALLLFALVLPMTALNPRWMVLGVQGAKAVAAGNVAGQLLFAAGVVVLVSGPHETYEVPVLQAVGEGLYAAVVIGVVGRRLGFIRPRLDLDRWRQTLKSGLPLMASNFARAVVYSFDVLLIGVLLERSDVGFYGAAYKPVLFLAGGMALFYMAFLSAFSRANAEQALSLFRQAVLWSGGAATVIALTGTLASGSFVSLVFGDSYAPAAGALRILCWTIPVLAVAAAYANALIAANRQSVLMRNNIWAAVFNVVANAVAIPVAGIEGAAAVTVASELLVLWLHHRAAVEAAAAPSLFQLITRQGRSAVASGAG